jgi:hypothetical protein
MTTDAGFWLICAPRKNPTIVIWTNNNVFFFLRDKKINYFFSQFDEFDTKKQTLYFILCISFNVLIILELIEIDV